MIRLCPEAGLPLQARGTLRRLRRRCVLRIPSGRVMVGLLPCHCIHTVCRAPTRSRSLRVDSGNYRFRLTSAEIPAAISLCRAPGIRAPIGLAPLCLPGQPTVRRTELHCCGIESQLPGRISHPPEAFRVAPRKHENPRCGPLCSP
jgi:hypothetical protein